MQQTAHELHATSQATELAVKNKVTMAVTFDPYAENPEDEYGFMPLKATTLFPTHKILKTISP